MKHILFGSIGVLAETSAIQQACYNQALAEFDTGIYWNTATYCHLIREPGGYQRLENLGIHAPKAKAIHERKQQLFAENLVNITPRAGIVSLIDSCRDKGVGMSFVTTTTPLTLHAITTALSGAIPFDDFTVITSAEDVAQPKPSSLIYHHALSEITAKTGVSAQDMLAIEDTSVNCQTARDAGLACLFTPGDYALVNEGEMVCCDLSYAACEAWFESAKETILSVA